MEAIFIVAIIFGSIASLFIVPRYFKSVERQKMADTLRAAIEKGQPLPTEVIEAMSSNVRSPGLPPSPSDTPAATRARPAKPAMAMPTSASNPA